MTDLAKTPVPLLLIGGVAALYFVGGAMKKLALPLGVAAGAYWFYKKGTI